MPVTVEDTWNAGDFKFDFTSIVRGPACSTWLNIEPKTRPHFSVALCGSSSSGKSTLAGRCFYELGHWSQNRMEYLYKEASEMRGSIEGLASCFALGMDIHRDEQRACRTSCSKFKPLTIQNYDLTLIDVPGRRAYIKHAIRGISNADVAIFVVPATGSFEPDIASGKACGETQKGQTRIHAELVFACGIRQIVVCVNLMDMIAPECREDRFNEIKRKIVSMLISVGWKRDFVEIGVPIIPASGLRGYNVVQPFGMDWWKGCHTSGHCGDVSTIYEALDKFSYEPMRSLDAPLRMMISERYKIRGVGHVYAGFIRQGNMHACQEVRFLPNRTLGGIAAHVKRLASIETHRRPITNATAGGYVGCLVKNLRIDGMPRRGDLMVSADDHTVQETNVITAHVKVLGAFRQITVGYAPLCFIGAAKSRCRLATISWKKSRKIQGELVADPTGLEPNDLAEVELQLERPLACDTFERCQALGRLIVVDSLEPVMFGKIVACRHDAIKYSMKRGESRVESRRGRLCVTIHAEAESSYDSVLSVWCTNLAGSEIARIHCHPTDSFKSVRLALYRKIRHHGAVSLVITDGRLLEHKDDNLCVGERLGITS